jgi:glycosyltransferase involved in cell wall biosynthesis
MTDASLAETVRDVEVIRTPARHVSGTIARLVSPLKRLRGGGSAPGAAPLATAAARPAPPLSTRLARMLTMDDASLWAGPAVRAAVRAGRVAGVDAVVASGPPYSVTVAGMRTARTLGVPFVADMRDLWRDNPAAVHPSAASRRSAEAAEREVLGAARAVTAVAPPIADEAQEMGARNVRLLPNGYDPADLPARAPDPSAPLRLAFMGKVYRAHSDPAPLFEALRGVPGEAAVTLDMIGECPEDVCAEATAPDLSSRVALRGYLPHGEALARVATADIGVVLIADLPGARASVTGKIFEYLGMGLPVLVVGPTDGKAAELVREADAGWVVAPSDVDGLVSLLERLADEKARAGTLAATPDRAVVERFDRRLQARTLARLLDEVSARG